VKINSLEYVLFAFYLFVFAWLVTKTRFFTKSDLSKPQLVIIFLLKIIIAIFYGWMGYRYAGVGAMDDTWMFHTYGVEEYHLLGHHPKQYFTNLFYDAQGERVQNFFGSRNSYWNDLKSNIFIKLLSVFDILSFGYYYINVIFYSFITLFGTVGFYRVMREVFPMGKKLMIATVFFIPSFFYWSNGVGKEGLIFTGIALIIYHLYYYQQEKRIAAKRVTGVLLGLLILLCLRNFLLLIIIPAIAAWLVAMRFPKYPLRSFLIVYLLFGIAFFGVRYVIPGVNLPLVVVNKQQAFIHLLRGNTSIPIRELEPNFYSFLINTPQAISLSLLRPYPTDVKHFFSLVSVIEIEFLLLMLGLSIFLRKKNLHIPNKNVFYFCLFFSFSVLLATGFSVNNIGAIIRYRSIIFPLLFALFIPQAEWSRLKRSIFNIKK